MFIWHTFTASPQELGRPGFEYFAGTHINTNITWWKETSGIFGYIDRCQKLLRQGLYTADICAYTSDRNYIGWGHGEFWNPDSKLVPASGTKFDLLDTNVLVNRLEFREKDGRLVLPHGMSYKILVIDPLKDEPLPVEALEKALKLAEAGAVVVLGENIPLRNPGLRNVSDRDTRLAAVCEKLWKHPDSESRVVSIGKGRIYVNALIPEVLAAENILPDFEGDAHFIHLADAEADRYFVAGSGTITCTFRAGGIPEIYDPLTDETRPALAYSGLGDGRTRVTLPLAVNGSAFVIFHKMNCLCAAKHFTSVRSETPKMGEISENTVKNTVKNTAESTSGSTSGNASGNGAESAVFNALPDCDFEYASSTPDGMKFHIWTPSRNIFTDARGVEKVLEAAESELPAPLDLSRDWTLKFAPNLGAPEGNVHFDALTRWDENPDPGIRFFSGTCTYTKKFTLPADAASDIFTRPARLCLGAVNHVAAVRINGKDAGHVWTAPWTVNAAGMLVPGENTVEIDVTNVWMNRLIGDAGLEKEKRISRTNVYLLPEKNEFKRYQGFFATDRLAPSGLLGPVKIQFGIEKELKF